MDTYFGAVTPAPHTSDKADVHNIGTILTVPAHKRGHLMDRA
jgi:hypothetical protein